MEDSTASPNVPIYKMDYAQLRAANIERNNQKLRELFGTDKVSFMPEKPNRPNQTGTEGEAEDRKKSVERTFSEIQDERATKLKELISNFPHRKAEIQRIWGYLEETFCPAPALLVHGPSGCGKSDMCSNAILSMKLPHIRIICSGFSSQKQIMRYMWHEVTQTHCSGHRRRDGRDKDGKDRLGDDSWSSAKAPNNFSDLVGNLKTLLLSSSPDLTPPRSSMLLLLDDINAVEALEKGLTIRLLSLPELCHAKIKVIATVQSLLHKAYPCILLYVPAYANQQIKEILLKKVAQQGISLVTSSTERKPGAREKQQNDEKLSESESAVVGNLLTNMLPRLTTITNHIGELWEITQLLLRTIRGMNESAGGEVGLDVAAALTTASASLSSNMRTLTAGTITRIIQEQLQMPLLHMGSCTSFYSAAGNDTSLIGVGTKRRTSASSSAMAALEKFPRLHTVAQIVDPPTLRGQNACVDLPLSIKYLLIAVFLASNNAKETDDFVFAMRQRGRRKKQHVGTDTSQIVDAIAARTFTLDRLLSIFAQVACVGGISSLGGGERAAIALGRSSGLPEPSWVAGQIEEYYGDARLFAAIHDLEVQRYLVRGPGWSIDRPVFLSAVPYKLASEIARGVSFDLEAYRSY